MKKDTSKELPLRTVNKVKPNPSKDEEPIDPSSSKKIVTHIQKSITSFMNPVSPMDTRKTEDNVITEDKQSKRQKKRKSKCLEQSSKKSVGRSNLQIEEVKEAPESSQEPDASELDSAVRADSDVFETGARKKVNYQKISFKTKLEILNEYIEYLKNPPIVQGKPQSFSTFMILRLLEV